MERFSDFRISDACGSDIVIAIVAFDRDFGGDVVAIEIPMDVPSDRDQGCMALAEKIVKFLNG